MKFLQGFTILVFAVGFICFGTRIGHIYAQEIDAPGDEDGTAISDPGDDGDIGNPGDYTDDGGSLDQPVDVNEDIAE
jgi:hypothetical protein